MLALPPWHGEGMSATERRNQPGRAFLGRYTHLLPRVTTRREWLRGDRQLSRIPYHIAEKLDNRDFSSFDSFRTALWKLVAADGLVSGIYTDDERRRTAMRTGVAPRAPASQQVTRTKLILSGGVEAHVKGARADTDGLILAAEVDPETLSSYQVHHHPPINAGGNVYEISCLIIVTPLMHEALLDPSVHYGNLEDMPAWKQEYIDAKIAAWQEKQSP